MPKLSDIATKIGVSNKTVSLTLRGKKCASEETTRRILEYADQIGYTRNTASIMGVDKQVPVIGFLANVEYRTPHSSDILQGAQAEATKRGIPLLIGSLDSEDDVSEESMLKTFRACRATGVIYSALFHRKVERVDFDETNNVVYANCFADGLVEKSILPDDEMGGFEQANHLLKLGHKRIAVLTLPMQAPASVLRMKGIERAFFDQGVVMDPELCALGVEGYLPQGHELYVAEEKTKEFLSRSDRPTAIICGNDRMAHMVYNAVAQMGLNIPEDVSIVGFDDFQPHSEAVLPGLTTVNLPYYEIGVRAVRAAIEGQTDPTCFGRMPCELVERDSCAAPSI